MVNSVAPIWLFCSFFVSCFFWCVQCVSVMFKDHSWLAWRTIQGAGLNPQSWLHAGKDFPSIPPVPHLVIFRYLSSQRGSSLGKLCQHNLKYLQWPRNTEVDKAQPWSQVILESRREDRSHEDPAFWGPKLPRQGYFSLLCHFFKWGIQNWAAQKPALSARRRVKVLSKRPVRSNFLPITTSFSSTPTPWDTLIEGRWYQMIMSRNWHY